MKYVLVLFAFLLGCPSTPPTIAYPEQVSVLPRALRSTVALVSKREEGLRVFCSGVAHAGRVLTAQHCVDDALGGTVEVSFFSEALEDGYFSHSRGYLVAHEDALNDLAVLVPVTLDLPPAESPLSPQEAAWGDKAVIIGHPLGLNYSVAAGIVSHPRRVFEREEGFQGRVWMQVSSPVYFGNSGGPVFNQYGEVIGIVSFLMREPHLGGAVHLETIRGAVGARQ